MLQYVSERVRVDVPAGRKEEIMKGQSMGAVAAAAAAAAAAAVGYGRNSVSCCLNASSSTVHLRCL